MTKLLAIWCTLLTVYLLWSFADTHKPVSEPQLLPPEVHTPAVPQVGGDDVAIDPASGYCYRLVYVPATDRYPASVVTTDGVNCPWGVGGAASADTNG